MSVELKQLLRQRHWQTYDTFCIEYDRFAGTIDARLVGTWPSRAQFHRWLSGSLRGLPYPDHCRVLESMFPGMSALQLFARRDSSSSPADGDGRVRLIASGSELTAAMTELVGQAKNLIVSVGSRSREPGYLLEIERTLERMPAVVHYRILIGLPHSQTLKDHLARLIELEKRRVKRDRRKRLFISMLDDLVADHERFFVATEQAAVVILPSANSPGNFDTGLYVGDSAYVRGLVEHGKALYGRRRLETAAAVDALEVLR